MRLDRLTKAQVKKVYQERMKEDFPPNELKPLAMINKAVEQGSYECLGLMDGEEIAGYVFLIKHGEDYLVDYLATYPKRRNHGLGREMIRLLGEYLADAKSIIGEVENPEFAINEEMGQGIAHTAEEIKDLYKMHYKTFLPGVIYKKCIIV